MPNHRDYTAERNPSHFRIVSTNIRQTCKVVSESLFQKPKFFTIPKYRRAFIVVYFFYLYIQSKLLFEWRCSKALALVENSNRAFSD